MTPVRPGGGELDETVFCPDGLASQRDAGEIATIVLQGGKRFRVTLEGDDACPRVKVFPVTHADPDIRSAIEDQRSIGRGAEAVFLTFKISPIDRKETLGIDHR